MNISVKFKALLLVSTMVMVSLGGYVLLLLNMSAMEQGYNEQNKISVEQSIRTEADIPIAPNSKAFAFDCRNGLIATYPADKELLLQPVSKLGFMECKTVMAARGESHGCFLSARASCLASGP